MANVAKLTAHLLRCASRWLARAALLLALGVAGMVVALALTPETARAQVARPAEAAITGTVVNGTQGGAIVGGLSVTLQSLGGNGTHDLASMTTDTQGRFAFPHLPDADGSVYAVYTRFQQALFTTGAITVQGGTQDVTLTVYDVTASDAALRITSITALVRDPRPVNGLIGVGEFFTFHNSGNTAYLGSTQPANGMPMNLLRFALPSGATNVTLGAGFDGAQSTQVATGFGATATVPPGDSQFAFAFDMPYTGTQCTLPIKAEYPADSVLLLVPPGFHVTPQGMDARGALSSNGEQYNAFTHGALNAGTQVGAQLAGLPQAGEAPTLNFAQLVALVGVLALLLASLVALYLRRGTLAVALPALARRGRYSTGRVSSVARHTGEDERTMLLGELIELQRARDAGRISAAQFRRHATDVRAALRQVIATELNEVQARTMTGDVHLTEREAPAEADEATGSSAVAADAADPPAVVDGDHLLDTEQAPPPQLASEVQAVQSPTASGGSR